MAYCRPRQRGVYPRNSPVKNDTYDVAFIPARFDKQTMRLEVSKTEKAIVDATDQELNVPSLAKKTKAELGGTEEFVLCDKSGRRINDCEATRGESSDAIFL